MIVPNLMVTDMARSIAFYRDVIGMDITMMISADHDMLEPGQVGSAVFALLECSAGQMMLQTNESLADELPVFQPDQCPAPAGTIYFRSLDPDLVHTRAAAEQVLKTPFVRWYGMKEVYLQDPDGHVICIGTAEGPPPA
jgi:catechol 2,3-dioxygenase-like lactoylglutathione lyase family enzyme